MHRSVVLSVDAMGGDHGPAIVVEGIEILSDAFRNGGLKVLLHGDEALLKPLLKQHPKAARICELRHTATSVTMSDKPSQAIRKARGSSMWNAIDAVKSGDAHACVSAGNTGALMVLSKILLHMAPNAHRPAIAACWPTMRGVAVVLDVGANVECTATQLVEFAIMGGAFFSANQNVDSPIVGLLNIGTEEMKGNQAVRDADAILRKVKLDLNYTGFVEGDGISKGVVDVVVTDGFTGNIAIKTAEGTAKLAATFLRESLESSLISKIGALLSMGAFRKLRAKMDPRKFNGGVFLGLGGLVVKSHGGTDGLGFSNALKVALNLARSDYAEHVAGNLKKLAEANTQSKLESVSK